ncbi:cell filamentation protein Fic [Cryobacterium adonitolivorans]|uniref:protein adenylyltransferase n=1 Tax=Cryobacterium adonitolivorans TaxID=1259189 RepID=A0A4R8W2W9_9MICO|nr:Fic family protein [Cryobacterium adonitolivorans]TFC01467.1 cell filamentation protein Fic [Cryobacterium adonitolivorans]
MAAKFRAWDDYFIPGTTVLRNKFNETDAAKLGAKEEAAASIRLDQLANKPIPPTFDYDHMKAIHRHVFQDVYDWAGQERVGPLGKMTKAGPDVVNFQPGDPAAPTVAYGYYPSPAITAAAQDQYRNLGRENHLVGMPQDQFISHMAEHWGELNTIHSFREGNTRAQFVFFSQLADNAGYKLDTEAFKMGSPLRDEFVAARFYNQATTKTDRLEAVLSKALESRSISHEGPESASAQAMVLSPELQRIIDVNKRNFPTSATAIGRPGEASPAEGRGYQARGQGRGNDQGYGR